MPNRLIRDGFLDSESVHNLSDAAECFYHRLLLCADDAGRFDGRVDVLRSRLFPLEPGRRARDLDSQLDECIHQRLVRRYSVSGKTYLQVFKWQRYGNSKQSKYPDQNGEFSITFLKVQTKNGIVEFVSSSLSTPSAPHVDGGQEILYEYVDGDEDGYEVEDASCSDPPPAESEPPPVLIFPCIGTGRHEWPLLEVKILEWSEAYPGIDVLAECRKSRQWCIDNPKRRKTFDGMTVFINRWLAKAQNDGNKTGTSGGNPRNQAASRLQTADGEKRTTDSRAY